MPFIQALVILMTFLFLASTALAKVSDSPDPLFQINETLPVTLTAALATLIEERSTESYLSGLFEYAEPDGTVVKLKSRFEHPDIFDATNVTVCQFV